jgi:hypothetical protein
MYSDQNLGNFRVHIVICSTTHRVVRVFDFDNFKFSHKLKLDFFFQADFAVRISWIWGDHAPEGLGWKARPKAQGGGTIILILSIHIVVLRKKIVLS